MMVTGDTNFGAVSPTRVFGDVGLYRTWFSQMDSLERGPTDPDATDAVIPVYMPCANGLVHVFDDLPHPAVALMRVHGIQQAYPAAMAAGFNGLIDWFKAACHRGPAGPSSILATSWASIQNDDVGLHQWGQGRHDTMLPPLPVPAPAPITPPWPGLTESESRAIAREVAQSARDTDSA